jgi:hypothetical protein
MTILKNAPEITCFLLLFSPWGSLERGRELHENYTPTQIHQHFCHHYADIFISLYVQNILNPSAMTLGIEILYWYLSSLLFLFEVLRTTDRAENFVVITDELNPLPGSPLFLQCTRCVIKVQCNLCVFCSIFSSFFRANKPYHVQG